MPLTWRHVRASDGTLSYLWALIDFRGPALLPDLVRRTYPTCSFFDVLQSQEQIDAKVAPTVDPARVRDKTVFVGTTAAALCDVFETPSAFRRRPWCRPATASAPGSDRESRCGAAGTRNRYATGRDRAAASRSRSRWSIRGRDT